MNENNHLHQTLLEQIQRNYDSRDKSRNYLETKLTILLTQSGILLGLTLTLSNSMYKIYAIPFFLAILAYTVGIWPTKIWDNPSDESLTELAKRIKNGTLKTPEELYELLSCVKKPEYLKVAFDHNIKMLKVKNIAIMWGLIINLIGAVLWLLAVIFPCLMIQ